MKGWRHRADGRPLSDQVAVDGDAMQALGDRKGISRFGNFSAPLDEALINVVLVRPCTDC